MKRLNCSGVTWINILLQTFYFFFLILLQGCFLVCLLWQVLKDLPAKFVYPVWSWTSCTTFLFLDKVDSEFSWYFLLAFFKYTIFLVFSLMFVSFKVSLNTWNVFLAAKILNELNLEVTEIFAFQGFIYSSIYKRGLYFNKITAPSMTGLPLESLLIESKR